MKRVLELHGCGSLVSFLKAYEHGIAHTVQAKSLTRNPIWTESIAVGSETFVKEIEEKTTNRVRLEVGEVEPGRWTIQESPAPYGQ